MTIEKKFFSSAATYGNTIITGKKWFIIYRVPDYLTGVLKKKKYYGEINKYNTVSERLAEIEKIKKLFKEKQPLPNLRGAKRLQSTPIEHNFAGVIHLMTKSLNDKKVLVDKTTYECYQSKVRILEEWLINNNYNNISIAKFSKEIAYDFLMYLKTNGYKNNTYNNYKIVFGSIWEDIAKKLAGTLKINNVWRELKTLKKITQPYKTYTSEIENIIAQNLPLYDSQLWLFMLFTHYCFIRGSENRKLKIEHINFINKTITINSEIAKTHKQRTVAVPEHLYQEMINYNLHTYDRDCYIFSRSGYPSTKQIGKNYFRIHWQNFRKKFDIPNDFKLYASKHTGIIKANMNGIDVKEIQLQTGHHSLDQLNEYMRTMNPQMLDNLRLKFPKLGDIPERSKSNEIDNIRNSIDDLKGMMSEILSKVNN